METRHCSIVLEQTGVCKFSPTSVKTTCTTDDWKKDCDLEKDCDAVCDFWVADPDRRVQSIAITINCSIVNILKHTTGPRPWIQLEELFHGGCPLFCCMQFAVEHLEVTLAEGSEPVTVTWNKLKLYSDCRLKLQQAAFAVQYPHGIAASYSGGMTVIMRESYSRCLSNKSQVGHFQFYHPPRPRPALIFP